MSALPEPVVEDNVIYVLPPRAVRAVAVPVKDDPLSARLFDAFVRFKSQPIVEAAMFQFQFLFAVSLTALVVLGSLGGFYAFKCGLDIDLVPGFSLSQYAGRH